LVRTGEFRLEEVQQTKVSDSLTWQKGNDRTTAKKEGASATAASGLGEWSFYSVKGSDKTRWWANEHP